MSVSIVNEAGKIYVQAKRDDAPKGSEAATGIAIPVENQEQAESLKAELEKAEAKVNEQLKSSGVDTSKVKEATVQPEQAKKLNTTA